MVNFIEIRHHVISRLSNELPASLTYHNLQHTLDVETQCLLISKAEGITNDQLLLELRLAALYHDTGFIQVYKGHEQKSCEIASDELHGFGFNDKIIENISQLILATQVPQRPKNIIQEIICDADLDYLGRDDYFIINENLHREFIYFEIICDEETWESSRIAFLESHSYFTHYATQKRAPKKMEHLLHFLNIKRQV